MARQERLSNLGYLGLAPEATKGTAATPTDFCLLYDETLTTDRNLQEMTPISGNKYETYKALPGPRAHKGDLTVVGEPNTAAKFFDMLLTRGSPSLAYTFTVTSANATIGATYTNNGATFTVVSTITASTTLLLTGTGAPSTSGTLTKASGTGDATITFSAATNTSDTWPFTLGTTNPKSYTIDISTGNVVKRFFGVEASKIVPAKNKNELQLKVSVSALGSFEGREISSIAGSGSPYTINLKTDYSSSPTNGLVVGDLIRVFKANGTTIDITVASIASGTAITTTTDVTSAAAGDFIYLRPQTASFNSLNPFLWTSMQFCFADTAANALAATQTRVEDGSSWELDHYFESDDGAQRSGSQDPAALVRTTGKAMLNIKKFFDTPEDIEAYNNLAKSAAVIRMFPHGDTTHELRITFNNLVTNDPIPQLKEKEIAYSNIKFIPIYDGVDGQGFDVKVINNLTAIA